MRIKPKVIVLTGYGINCDRETQHAFNLAGGDARRVHVGELIDRRAALKDYQILALPGGFSFGDDIASGRVLASKLKTRLAAELSGFVDGGGLVIGICNGFQVLVSCGLLPGLEADGQRNITLTYNLSGRYEDRWVHLECSTGHSVFLMDVDGLYLPVAHGEGRFLADEAVLDELARRKQIALCYTDGRGNPAEGCYPDNPNGAARDIAAICDGTGRVLGMMPHPERYLHYTNHPQWTALADRARRRGELLPEAGEGLKIFKNGVDYFN